MLNCIWKKTVISTSLPALEIVTNPVDLALPEAVVHRCSLKYVSLKNSQYSQENNCAGVSF